MAKVLMTCRSGRKVIHSVSVEWSGVLDYLMNTTMGAYAPIAARAALSAGERYKFKADGMNVTLAPLVHEEY